VLPKYLPRLADQTIAQLTAVFAALLVTGPRAVGKTTTAARYAHSELRLDQPGIAAMVRADPDAALRGRAEPILIDEWQLAPEILGAVKRAVDADRRPGRFIVTGSVHGRFDAPTWPGTGRLIHVRMTALTARELLRRDLSSHGFVETLSGTGISGLVLPEQRPDLRGYVELALTGGFPEPALDLTERTRMLWIANYLTELFTRDLDAVVGRRDTRRLTDFFRAYALNTAGVVPMSTLVEAARIDRRTADSYEALLEDLYIVQAVPAWTPSRLSRMVKTPKRFVVDSGLVASSIGLTVDGVMADHDVLGRLLETFVAAQLRAELSLTDGFGTLYHLREHDGRREIDLLVERPDGRVIAIEVKATSAPTPAAAKHLRWLRDELGDRFVAGIVLHSGPEMFPIDHDIAAVPMCALWE
jgi:predicted AAA+ superfamily ATPase